MASIEIRVEEIYAIAWRKFLEQGAPKLVEYAIEEAPVDTGALAASISFEETGPISGRLVAASRHAAVTEEGHGDLYPTSQPLMKFLWKLAGHWVSTGHVNPVAPNPFLIRACRRLGLQVD